MKLQNATTDSNIENKQSFQPVDNSNFRMMKQTEERLEKASLFDQLDLCTLIGTSLHP
jgi:hypothetical protein